MKLDIWLNHPETGKDDTMLTVAVAGFIFSIMFTTASIVAAWVLVNPDFLSHVAMIDAAILTPSLAAYTARKFTDQKYKPSEKPIEKETEVRESNQQ